jgi:hypothetical protein
MAFSNYKASKAPNVSEISVFKRTIDTGLGTHVNNISFTFYITISNNWDWNTILDLNCVEMKKIFSAIESILTHTCSFLEGPVRTAVPFRNFVNRVFLTSYQLDSFPRTWLWSLLYRSAMNCDPWHTNLLSSLANIHSSSVFKK